jgi:hypothetical protein
MKTKLRAVFLRGAGRAREFARRDLFAMLLGFLTVPKAAQKSAEGKLSVEVRDHETGQIVPAMVCITSLSDHKWRTPPDGRSSPPYTTVRNFYVGLPDWKPGDIGPVRLTNGEYHDNDTRSFVYEGKSSYPFWQEPAAYFVSQPFSIALPEGKWRLGVYRGLEYLPVFGEFEISPGEKRNQKVRLRRWVDMAKEGWYSGDDHVHLVRMRPEQNELLMTWARAEDVHVSNILRQGELTEITFDQIGFGKNSRYQQGDYVLVSGQEDPSTEIHEQGHAIALNIQEPFREASRYHLYDLMFDAVHGQGGLAGYAHLAWAQDYYRQQRADTFATWDTTINVVRGKVDFLEILQFRSLGLEDFYDFLNLGYRLTASAGSDVPWGNTIGEVRMYVFTGPSFSADAWFTAMKDGHTFVTNGPMLTLTADAGIPGDEVRVLRNAKVRIRARAWAPECIASPKTLEVVVHGQVVRAVESDNPNRSELQLDFPVQAGQSLWIAARATSHNGAVAHTTPIYVTVDGESFRNQKEVPQLVEKRLKVLEYILGRLRDSTYIATYHPGEVAALREEVEQARTIYRGLLPKS